MASGQPRTATRRRQLAADALVELVEDLGPTFVKLGQLLGSRPDLLPQAMIRALSRLYVDVSYGQPGDAADLEAAIDDRLRLSLARVDTIPLARGSVATVYRGQLTDGRPVAIKVIRVGVADRIRHDFAVLETIARWAGLLPTFRRVPIRGVVAELRDLVEGQLDLAAEGSRQSQIRANLEATHGLTIPRVHHEASTENALVMELIPEFLPIPGRGLTTAARRTAAESGLRALYQMIFHDGLVHADMHPGNLCVTSGGTLVMLDFGIVASVPGDVVADFRYFFLSMALGDGPGCARTILRTATSIPETLDREAFSRAISDHVAAYHRLPAGHFEVSTFVVGLFDIQRSFGILGSTAFTQIIVSLLVYEGVVKQLDPTLDFQAEAHGYLLGLLRRPAEPIRASRRPARPRRCYVRPS